jgi:maleate isomerase
VSKVDNIQQLPYSTDAGLGQTAKIGLIVLQTDQTIEHEFRQILNIDGVACYHARIANAMHVTPETLAQMQADLPFTASLLPTAFTFDAIGYACTSGATIIGEQQVAQLILAQHPHAKVSNPLSACKAACGALNLKSIALLTPYTPEVTQALNDNLYASGIEVSNTGHFNIADDFEVGRVDSASIYSAIIALGQHKDCEGVFVSCTSLRVANIILKAEKHLGKPVISSNQALAWHLLRLSGVDEKSTQFGCLFNHGLPH